MVVIPAVAKAVETMHELAGVVGSSDLLFVKNNRMKKKLAPSD